MVHAGAACVSGSVVSSGACIDECSCGGIVAMVVIMAE